MGALSKRKGAKGELEFAKFLKENFGVSARRGQQFSGSEDSPDVVTDYDTIHFEVKRTETLSLYKAMSQADEDSGSRVPVVAHRRSRKEWLVCLKAKDMLAFAKEIIKHEDKNFFIEADNGTEHS